MAVPNEALPVYLYKILPSPLPTPLPHVIPGTDLDRSEGFIHLSRARQLALPLSRFFADAAEITILKVVWASVEDTIRWDTIGSGDRYPHLLRDLKASDVDSWKTLKREGGTWEAVLEREKVWMQS